MEQPSVRETSERIELLLDELAQSAPPAVMRRVEELLQCVLALYGAGLDRMLRPSTPRRRSPAGRRRARRQPAGAARPAPRRRRHPGAARARPGAALPRLARRRRLALRGRRERRGAPPARGQLRRLPVLGADREERDRGRHPDGGARRGRRRGRGHGQRRRPRCCRSSPSSPHEAGGRAGPAWTSTYRPGRWPTCAPRPRATPRSWSPTSTEAWSPTSTAVRPACPRSRAGRSPATCSPAPAGRRTTCASPAGRPWRRRRRAAAAAAAAAGARRAGRWPSQAVPGVEHASVTGLGALRRLAHAEAAQAPEQEERCEFCAVDVGERHGHVADLQDHRLLCVCRPCYLLFGPRGSGGGRYRGVGEDVRRVEDLRARRRPLGRAADPGRPGLLLPPDRAPTAC